MWRNGEFIDMDDKYPQYEESLENTQTINRQLTKTVSGKHEKKQSDEKMNMFDWVQCFAMALVVGILIFMFVGRVIGVSGSSMYPTLHDTDKLIISNMFYKPEVGDIVVLQTDSFSEDPIVKRVIATEGQTVDIDFNAGIVYVDGVAQDEPYVNAPTLERQDFDGEVTVPEGCIFVMGDNRNASTDSRTDEIGMVDERCIIGKAYMIIIPGSTEDDPFDIKRFGSVY